MVIGSLGSVVFVVSTTQILTLKDYKRTTKHKYTQHEIINQKPVSESVGNELEEISFTIQFSRVVGVDPHAEMKKLRDMCVNHEAEFLILGGEVIGDCLFVVTEVGEAVEQWERDGKILASTVDVKLREYVTDGDAGGTQNLDGVFFWDKPKT